MPEVPHVLFWLAPQSAPALGCLQDPANQHYVGSVPGVDGLAFAIGFNCLSRTPGCLATFGRRGDIVLSGSRISRVQCEILLHPKTQEILIRDKSSLRNTRVYYHSDPESLYFSDRPGIPRQLVIRHGDAVQLQMSSDNDDLFKFEVLWPPPDPTSLKKLEQEKEVLLARSQNPALAVTHEDTSALSESRMQTPDSGKLWLHRTLTRIGSGGFGDVYKTVDMHTGGYFAVKSLRRPPSLAMEIEWRKTVLGEASLLQKLSNVSESSTISSQLCPLNTKHLVFR
jgi:hypothetical protein